jgi:hypothetical protein
MDECWNRIRGDEHFSRICRINDGNASRHAMSRVPESASPSFDVIGGEEEDRTPDLRIANAALSQLSYFPLITSIIIA